MAESAEVGDGWSPKQLGNGEKVQRARQAAGTRAAKHKTQAQNPSTKPKHQNPSQAETAHATELGLPARDVWILRRIRRGRANPTSAAAACLDPSIADASFFEAFQGSTGPIGSQGKAPCLGPLSGFNRRLVRRMT